MVCMTMRGCKCLRLRRALARLPPHCHAEHWARNEDLQNKVAKGWLGFLFHYFCSHPTKILIASHRSHTTFVRVLMRQSAILSRVCNIVGSFKSIKRRSKTFNLLTCILPNPTIKMNGKDVKNFQPANMHHCQICQKLGSSFSLAWYSKLLAK